jgi:hypothetical protein
MDKIPCFGFKSQVRKRFDETGKEILYFRISYQENNWKLRENQFKDGDKIEVTIRKKCD